MCNRIGEYRYTRETIDSESNLAGENPCQNVIPSPRISNPAISGTSMIADIDGKPCVIEISDHAIDAYERGNLPLSTLANAVLKKYDENNAFAEREYERGIHQELQQQHSLGIK